MGKVGIIMGSTSDLNVMQEAADILKGFDIEIEMDIVSAHRTPEKLYDYATQAHLRGISVIIAGAGGAAHLPGMVAALSPLPVIGVPVKSPKLHRRLGQYSFYSTNAWRRSSSHGRFRWRTKCRNFSGTNHRHRRHLCA